MKRIKESEEKEKYNINDKFTNILKDKIYIWYVDGDFLLLKFMFIKEVLKIIFISYVYYVRKKKMTLNM